VKSLGNFPDPFIAEISGQPDALRRAAEGLERQADALAACGRSLGGTLFFTGMGSSYDACYPGVTSLAAGGVPAVMLDSAELLHFRLPMLHEGDTAVLVSQSGESAETVRAAQLVRQRGDAPFIVAVTNDPDSSLAREADVTLRTFAGEETGPSTMTFAAALTVVGAIAMAIEGVAPDEVARRMAADAEAAAQAIDELLAHDQLAEDLVTWHGGRATTVLLARGGARAAAEMGALTLKEAVGMPVESFQAAQFRHGPLEIAGPQLAAMVFATEPETQELDLGIAEELRALGAAVWTVTAGVTAPGATDIGPLHRLLSPAAAIVPAQLLAWRLAILAGREPGAYVHAAKVTTRE
jgi:glucosamine--fructose-6-phosphate aminotransferase (isomerizing)